MKHSHPTARANGFTADASKVSPRQFLARALTAFMPPPTEASEKADAARRFINASWGKPRETIEEHRAALKRETAEITARYRVARDLNAAVIL